MTDACPLCHQPLVVYRAVKDGWTLRCEPCDIYFYASDAELMTAVDFLTTLTEATP